MVPNRDSLDDMFQNPEIRANYVQNMFSEIAPKYDLVNRVMTFGLDIRWRNLVATAAVGTGADLIIDTGTGSGDLALECSKMGAKNVFGLDFAQPMLINARSKSQKNDVTNVDFAAADGTQLPLPDSVADAWTGAFVLRNIPKLDVALQEAHRVLKPGGRLITLDAARLQPSTLVQKIAAPGARFHFNKLVPLIGKILSGHEDAYSYLPVSADNFFSPSEFSAQLRINGFTVIRVFEFVFGTVMMHIAIKEQ